MSISAQGALAGSRPRGHSRTREARSHPYSRPREEKRLVSPADHAQHVSEHAAHKRTVRQRERRAPRDRQTKTTRSPSSFDEHQSEEEMRRADQQRVKRADLQRVRTRQNQRDDEHSTETARCCILDHSPDQQFDLAFVQDVRGKNKTHLRDVTATKQQTIRSTLPTAIKTSLKTQKKTVEVPQVHVIDKIASSCCAETEEGLERPKEMSPWRYRSIISAGWPEDCGSAPTTVHRQSCGRASGERAW